ncbi:HTH-type transcriptional activator IlvY [Bermanella marisrubri]|uniref:Transcriptional activator IlvY n=1 Tax=Bermanella marisrubri TaxID=207949 RepID=Q1N3G7_9GAMM|nr:HTH-type transcriptional activator IlvY [Bermanella marisrubri]EAT12907.1 Transcriptional activator IlvY [Oceanobacter sp. RED65] [Bermanella marisrubri]QIZ83223.1 HTH-type transcriptional activator IlvY [Bermanella marisrubri]
MDFKDLNQFVVLSETLHYGRAAQQCHTSASTISRVVQRLEEQLGQQLINRERKDVKLTRAGESFKEYAIRTLEQYQQLRDQLHTRTSELEGELSLYCSVTATYSFLSELLALFRQRHPLVDIRLRTGDAAQAVDMAKNGEVDIAIAARPDQLSPRLAFRPIKQVPLAFIAPNQSGPVSDALSQIDVDWKKIPMILSETGLGRVRVDNWFKQRQIKPQIYGQVSGHEAIVAMVALGFGVGVVPELVLSNSPMMEKVRILPVQPELEPFSVGLCTLNSHLNHPLVDAFWQVTEEWLTGQ